MNEKIGPIIEPVDYTDYRFSKVNISDMTVVVRCKDCCNFLLDRPFSSEDRDRDNDFYLCKVMNRYLSTNDYCSYGERKLKEPIYVEVQNNE